MREAHRSRFLRALEQVNSSHGNPGVAWMNLERRYSESHRHYHDLGHIDQMLSVFDRISTPIPSIELAIWYHDSVYDPHAENNEERSSEFFRAELGEYLEPTLVKNVIRLIRATDPRSARTGLADEDLIVDIDLSIFATSPEVYDRYSESIRMEYSFVEPLVFAKRRVELLRKFLAKPIYANPMFSVEEKVARINIQREIGQLCFLSGG